MQRAGHVNRGVRLYPEAKSVEFTIEPRGRLLRLQSFPPASRHPSLVRVLGELSPCFYFLPEVAMG